MDCRRFSFVGGVVVAFLAVLPLAPVFAGEQDLIITEVMVSPVGDDDYNEFIEIYNSGSTPVDVSACKYKEGSDDQILFSWVAEGIGGWSGSSGVVTDSTIIPAGGYAVILDQEYCDPAGDQPYNFPAGTIILTGDDMTIGDGELTATIVGIALIDSGSTAFTSMIFSGAGYPNDTDYSWCLKSTSADPSDPASYANSLLPGGSPGADNGNYSSSSVIRITEVMHNPAGGASEIPGDESNEFVELYNTSNSDVNLAGYKLRVIGSSTTDTDPIQSWDDLSATAFPGGANVVTDSTVIPAKGYAVVLDRNYLDPANDRPYDLPNGTVVLSVDAGGSYHFLGGDKLTASDNYIVLISSASKSVATMDFTTTDEEEGRSRELKLSSLDDGPNAYGPSKVLGGTPGGPNTYWSIYSQKKSDRIIIVNNDGLDGLYLGYPHTVNFYASKDGKTADFNFNGKVKITFPGRDYFKGYLPNSSGKIDGSVKVRFTNGISEDLRLRFLNRTQQTLEVSGSTFDPNIKVNLKRPGSSLAGKVVINEIMIDTESNQDWIELYNTTSAKISLDGVRIDNFTGEYKRYSDTISGVKIPAKGYAVFTRDKDAMVMRYGAKKKSSFHVISDLTQFSKSEDVVFLRDPADEILGGLGYRESWGVDSYISLERVRAEGPCDDRRNWGACMHTVGGTPGRDNSISVNKNTKADLSVRIKQKVFSRRIQNAIPIRIATTFPMKLKCFIRSVNYSTNFPLFENKTIGKGETYVHIFNGRNKEGDILPVGLYMVQIEGTNREFGKKAFARSVVIIGH